MSQALEMYNQVGNEEFTKGVTAFAPYFATIDPMFVALKPGYAEVTLPNTPKVHNHLGTVHAIAMCNAAELVAGTMTDASIPDTHRWIPKGMTVRYLIKATSDLRAVSRGDGLDWNSEGDIDVPVSIYDTDDREVFTAVITMKVSLKK